jgi:hypothetical protein
MMKPGAILIQRPFRQIYWCIVHRRWPTFVTLAHAICALAIMCLQQGYFDGTHVLQYIGNGEFVHTAFGRVRRTMRTDFPPGYLETCLVLQPKDDNLFDDAVRQAFLGLVGKRVSLREFFKTPLYRHGYIGVSIRQLWLQYYYDDDNWVLQNCIELLVAGWYRGTKRRVTEGFVDLACFNSRITRGRGKGIYPVDFLKQNPYFELSNGQ